MSLHHDCSTTLPKNVSTRLNLRSSVASGSHLYSVHNDCDGSSESEKMLPENKTSFSAFDEGACGEPQTAQHLVIDFTHNELDTAFVQKKCCDFWAFVESHPEIHHMMVMPDSQVYPSSTTMSTESSEEQTRPTTVTEEIPREHTAVSLLDIAGRDGLVEKSFETKLPQSFCTLGSREYIENTTVKRRAPRAKKTKLSPVCRCGGICTTCSRISAQGERVRHSSEAVGVMCDDMNKWDQQHPKSMDPPGRVVPLIHSVMQRNVS